MNVLDPNPLVSAQRSSDGLHVLLHPLALLTISDYITRHTLRQQEGPIVGALLGQQNGREVSLEHAFECCVYVEQDEYVLLNQSWFEERLQQFKDVLKVPALELVGWFTVSPESGPLGAHLPINSQILHTYNESAVLLTFHPSLAVAGATTGGKLPLTIYESVYEADGNAGDGEAQGKQAGVQSEAGKMFLRFRELPYSIDTGEAEMISVDFVARGGGNATAVDGKATPAVKDEAGKAVVQNGAPKAEEPASLSPEDEELIASLSARGNAVWMLHTRIQLLRSYLTQLPPSYLTSTDGPSPSTPSDRPRAEINHPILRSIQALLHRLPLLIPGDRVAFGEEMLAEQNDVSLVALLGSLNKSVKDVREVGRKYSIFDSHRQTKRGGAGGGPQTSDEEMAFAPLNLGGR
ncbi:MAG: hypothetical protein M1832_001402 [Thelocarpon impressellum]|nr:MAG: hypothetical protein M1832_001402 [Thelocarpon impressellum]